MRCSRFAPLVAGLLLAVASPVQAQNQPPLPAAAPLRFESWQAGPTLDAASKPALAPLGARRRDRKRQALLGGAIGAAAGVVFCTVISTLGDDSADGGLSFCPLDSYLLIGGAGFVLGAAIGWAI
jgi:hypothetical protein